MKERIKAYAITMTAAFLMLATGFVIITHMLDGNVKTASAMVRDKEIALGEAHQRIDHLTLAFDVAMENSNRLRSNLGVMRDFADRMDDRELDMESAMALANVRRPCCRPGWPEMQLMVKSTFWTNSAGVPTIQITEVGR